MNTDWFNQPGLEHLPEFLTALAIGLLIGLERERNPAAKAGLRTFALVAMTGAAAATLAGVLEAPSIIAAGLVAVAFTMIAAYYHHHEAIHDSIRESDPGTTTIAAVMVCYLLAAMAMTGLARPAAMLAIVATSLMYFKAELHGVAHRLERRDLVSILQFAAVAFVALPLLPDQAFGPYGALNLHHLWFMVVLISGVSLAGYAALRLVGREHGAVLLGVMGGLVSSTATTLAYSRYARKDSSLTGLAATVVIAANLVLLVRLTVLAAVVAPATLTVLAPVLATALAAGVAVAGLLWPRAGGLAMVSSATPASSSASSAWPALPASASSASSASAPAPAPAPLPSSPAAAELGMPDIKNPAELHTALGFAALYAVVLLLTAWLVDVAGSSGAYLAALVSGLTDVDAITLSSLQLYGMGSLSSANVAVSVVLAVAANSVFKLGVVWFAGSAGLFRRCAPVMCAAVMAAGVALWFFA